jgi:hypothetical protein
MDGIHWLPNGCLRTATATGENEEEKKEVEKKEA